MKRLIRALGALGAATLLLAACGSSSSSGGTPDAVGSAPPGSSQPDAGPVAGVTKDTITLGYTQIDFDALRKQYHVDLNFQNAQPVIQALVDDINAHGGVDGRKLIVKVGTYVPVGADSADALCVKFTEDDPVFAVLGGFSGPGAVDANPCITTDHNTILIGGTWTKAQHDAAKAPWLQVDMTDARRSVAFATALVAQGKLDGISKIAVIGDPASKPYLDAVQTAIEKGGPKVVLNATISGGESEIRTLLERATSEGATAVYYSGLNPTVYPVFADYDLKYFFDRGTKTEASLRDFISKGGKLDVISNGTFPLPYKDDPGMAQCIDIVEAHTNLTVQDPNTVADDQPDWAQAVTLTCQNLRLFKLIADKAGPDLTNASFLAAAKQLGTIHLPGVPFGSLGPDKFDVNNTTTLVTWSTSSHDGAGGWVPIGKPLDVS